MGWKKGDLGRFKNEGPLRPRFEVVGVNKEKRLVGVWYGGDNKTKAIPAATFKRDCVDHWEIEVVKATPDWLEPGAYFQLGEEGQQIVQAKVPDRMGRYGYTSTHNHVVEVGRNELIVRSIRLDYASCLIESLSTLVLIPLKVIAEHGYRHRSAWDRLGGDDFEPEVDPDHDLLTVFE